MEDGTPPETHTDSVVRSDSWRAWHLRVELLGAEHVDTAGSSFVAYVMSVSPSASLTWEARAP